MGESMGKSIGTMGKAMSEGKTMMGKSMESGDSCGDSCRDSFNLNGGRSSHGYRGSVGHGHGLGDMSCDSLGLVQGCVIGGLGLNDRFLGKDGLMLNNGLRDVLGGHDLAGVDGGNGSGLMDVGGLGNGVGDSGNLRGGLSIGMSLSNGVGKVATQAVVFNGGRVVSRGSD